MGSWAREGDVPEASLLFFAFGVAQGAGRGELAVGGPDDEEHAPFETFGLMNRGEREQLVFVAAFDHVFGGERLGRAVAFGRKEREFGEELFRPVVARAVVGGLAEVFEPRFGVLVVAL